MSLIPCRHLDYEEGKFTDCTIETCAPHFPDVRFWRRGQRWTDNGPLHRSNPQNVQFCKLRGRINNIFDCYEPPGPMSCHEPEEEKK